MHALMRQTLKGKPSQGLFFEGEEEWERLAKPAERLYAIMPYLHAEDREKQRLVHPRLRRGAKTDATFAFAGRIADLYLHTIERFGKFPHRNAMRGVPSSAEEVKCSSKKNGIKSARKFWQPATRCKGKKRKPPSAFFSPSQGWVSSRQQK